MFIVLEGADGTGKTTLCNILAERLGATPYASPPKKYQKIRASVDRNATAEEHYQFYRNGTYDASDEITVLLNNGKKVVCDRYWLSTYTYHQVMGVPVSVEDFQSIVAPTLTVLLVLNHETQIERMLNRGMTVGDIRVLDKQKDVNLAYYRNILEFRIPFIVIDTHRFSPEACADIAIKAFEV